MACLSSWIVMIRLRNTRSFRNPHRKKSGRVRSGDRAGQAMSPKRDITVPNIAVRSNDPLRLTIWNGVLSSIVLLHANHNKLTRRRNIQIWNVSVGSAPPGIILCFRVSLKKQFEENAVTCLLHCLQPDNTRIHKVPNIAKQTGNPP